MWRSVLFYALICTSAVLSWTQERLAVQSGPAVIPAFDQIKGLSNTIAKADYERLTRDMKAHLVIVRSLYSVHGPEVSAYVCRSRNRKGPLPVVILNRGGYMEKEPLPFLLPAMDRLANAGFLVIAPMLRGSDGQPGKDEMGGAEFADLAAAVNNVNAFGEADSKNIFMSGESRGGIMTYLSLRAGLPIRAAAVWGAITDMGEYLSHADPERKLAHAVWADFDEHRNSILQTRSALTFVDDLKAPLLIMHGGADRTVSPLHSLRLAMALQRRGREYELHIFAGDNHVLKANQQRRDRYVIEWFRKHELSH